MDHTTTESLLGILWHVVQIELFLILITLFTVSGHLIREWLTEKEPQKLESKIEPQIVKIELVIRQELPEPKPKLIQKPPRRKRYRR
jgi:hypothetical protein